MEAIILGIMAYSMFLSIDDPHFHTFEAGHQLYQVNQKSAYQFKRPTITSTSLGSREYRQITQNFRFGFASYIFSQSSKQSLDQQALRQQGGYLGYFFEFNLQRYFALGVLVGAGANKTRFHLDGQESEKRNYYGLASPYVTLGMPLTKTTAVNLTYSNYFLSEPADRIDGKGAAFENPFNLEHKIGLEFVWRWD